MRIAINATCNVRTAEHAKGRLKVDITIPQPRRHMTIEQARELSAHLNEAIVEAEAQLFKMENS